MPTDPAPLTLQERIERARAASAARATPAAPVPPAAPVAAPAPATPDAAASCTPRGSMTAQQRLIWDIVRAAQVNGAQDLTRREIWARWCTSTGRPQPNATVSGRVSELVGMGWLHERRIKRTCADSGNAVFPVYVPSHLLHAAPAQGGWGK